MKIYKTLCPLGNIKYMIKQPKYLANFGKKKIVRYIDIYMEFPLTTQAMTFHSPFFYSSYSSLILLLIFVSPH